MKVLFIGLGSAGQRHLRNLLKLDPDVEIIAFRQRGLTFVLDDKLEVQENQHVEKKYNIRVFTDINEALGQNPDIAFITNPTSMHIESALKAAQAGCDIFLEKPISHNMDNINELLSVIDDKKLISFVGYQNRFHPCIKKVKEVLSNNIIGDIIAVNAEVGEDIRLWHKYEDYRGMYAARKELGGGVAVTQIHELDYIQYLFGMPESVYAVGGKLSSLELDVEDTAGVLLRYSINGKSVPVHIHMDYIQSPLSRTCKIIGDKGKLQVDLITNSIIAYDSTGSIILCDEYNNFTRNDMFIEEMELFISCVKERCNSLMTVREGVKSLTVALAIQESIITGEIIFLQT